MPTTPPPDSILSLKADGFFADLPAHTAMLDQFGVIVAVNDRWKLYAEANGLTCADWAIGQNYLRHCAFADPQSAHIVKGLSQLLAGEIATFTYAYSCHSPSERRWFILLAFPYVHSAFRVALMHVDITAIASSVSRATGLADAQNAEGRTAKDDLSEMDIARTTALFEQSMLSAMSAARNVVRNGRERVRAHGGHPVPLSRRQQDVLALVSEGLTNGEIAKRLGLSENTIKIHVSGIFSRLGLESRAQVVHWALTRERGGQPGTVFGRQDRTIGFVAVDK